MEPTAQKTPAPFKKRLRKYLIIFTLAFIIGFWLFVLICGLPYSDGTRSGILTKVSRKGYIFKTYEGEMNVGGFNQGDGTIMPATIFKFSVTDDAIYKKLDSLQGRKVVLTYKQVYKNFFWQGETDYFIRDVRTMN
jgi:hypothetical protein